MPTWLDTNGDVVASTTFTDAQGRHYIAGVEVPDAVWSEHTEALERIETLEGLSRTHLAGCRGAKERLREAIGDLLDELADQGVDTVGHPARQHLT